MRSRYGFPPGGRVLALPVGGARRARAKPPALGLTVIVNSRLPARHRRPLIIDCVRAQAMHKTPARIARSLRAFRKAHKLGLLRSVHISPGPGACEEARSQRDVEYLAVTVPPLPLPGCTRANCQCEYFPVGSSLLRRLNVFRKRPSR